MVFLLLWGDAGLCYVWTLSLRESYGCDMLRGNFILMYMWLYTCVVALCCSCSILDVNLYVMFKARENIQPLGSGVLI